MARTIILMCAPEAEKRTLTSKGALQTEFVAKAIVDKKLIPDKILYSDQPGANEAARKLRAIFIKHTEKKVLLEETEWLQNGSPEQKHIRTLGFVPRHTYPNIVLMITGAGSFSTLTQKYHLSVQPGTTRTPFTSMPGLSHVFTNRNTDTWIDFDVTPGVVERLAVIKPPR